MMLRNLKRLIIATGAVASVVCQAPSASRAGLSSSTGKLVVNIAPAVGAHTFLAPGSTVWVYFGDINHEHNHLIGKRKISAGSDAPVPVISEIDRGYYHVFLLRYDSKSGRVSSTYCSTSVNIIPGSETEVGFPLTDSPTCDYPFDWTDRLLGRRGYQALGHAGRVLGDNSPDPYWLQVDDEVRQVHTKWCPETAAALQKLYSRILMTPPSKPVVFINGFAVGEAGKVESNPAEGQPALDNMELDADLVRLAVVDVKARCWNWFLFLNSDDTPEGPNVELYQADQEAVQQYLRQLDRLNGIADILDQVAREQREQ